MNLIDFLLGKKKIVIIILVLMPCGVRAFQRYQRVVKFDGYFSKYSKRYFGPNFNWIYFKAQAIAESRLKADAKSKVGAAGVMQIMPKTAVPGNRCLYQPR